MPQRSRQSTRASPSTGLSFVARRTGRLTGWFDVQWHGWATHFDGGWRTGFFVVDTLTGRQDAPVQSALVLLILVTTLGLAVWCLRRPFLPFGLAALLGVAVVVASTNFWHSKPRLLLAAIGMFVLEAPALVVGQLWNLWGLVLVMLVAGAATAPMLITAMSLSQHLVPRALLTEALAVAVTGILIGISLGASLGGIAVDHLGAHAAYAVPVGAGLIATLLALIRYRPLSAAERAAVGT